MKKENRDSETVRGSRRGKASLAAICSSALDNLGHFCHCISIRRAATPHLPFISFPSPHLQDICILSVLPPPFICPHATTFPEWQHSGSFYTGITWASAQHHLHPKQGDIHPSFFLLFFYFFIIFFCYSTLSPSRPLRFPTTSRPTTTWSNPDLCHMTLKSPCRAKWLPGDLRPDRMSHLSTATNEPGTQKPAWLAVMRCMLSLLTAELHRPTVLSCTGLLACYTRADGQLSRSRQVPQRWI